MFVIFTAEFAKSAEIFWTGLTLVDTDFVFATEGTEAAEIIGFTEGVFQTAYLSKVLNSTQSELLRSVQILRPVANLVGRCEAG